MLTFYELGPDNLCALPLYLEKSPSHFCDLTLGNIYMWRKELNTYFAVRNDTLIVRKELQKGVFAYLFPLGEDIEGALEEMEDYAFAHHERLAFYALNEEEAVFLSKRYPHHQSLSLRNWSDYLYNLADLRDFPGKRYEGKRHNANRFHRDNPEVVLKEATPEDLPRLNAFLDLYLMENKDSDISGEEVALTREMLAHPTCIKALLAYYEKNGEVIAFSLGEKKGDCLYNHIEKALRNYEGIYQAITSDFLKKYGEGLAYSNREEDDGNEGLRGAKLQLKPVELLQKFYFEVTNPIDLVKAFPPLEGERLLAHLVQKEELTAYTGLALDAGNNRYWGYDYRSDLGEGEVADEAYFQKSLASDLAAKKFVSFSLLNKEGVFLGEVVLYHFTSLQGAEIGIRLKKEAQGKGYAQEALRLFLDYAKNVLGLSYLEYESYKANLPSLALTEKVGFTLLYEDKERRHYLASFH
jgi:RimJ/RimL family protein N-acetyltransferase